ncbi:MAG: PKD domain-containing protein, partial [Gammaproteobacteria bacterium]
VPKLVPVHPKVVLPANRKGVTASDARVRSFLSSSAEIPAGEGPSVLMAEDAQGHSLLLGYAIPPGSEKRIAQRVGQAAAQQAKQVMDAGNTEISTRSTALALVMLAIGGMNADVDRAALAARVLVHPEFDLLVGQIDNAFRADPYFLDSLMNNASLVGRIKAFATRVFEEYVNDERMARLGAGAASGPRTAASQGQSLPADRLAAVGAALPITATGPKTFWYLSPWHSDQPWYWYEVPRKYLVDPPFVAEARGKHLYASGNPTNINYIAEFFSRDGRKLDWRMVPRNSTLIQKLANSGAAQRKWRWGRDIASNVAHVEFNKYITTGDDPQKRAMMDGLFLLHAVTGVVNVFTGTRVFSGLASRLEHNTKLALTLATCGTNLVSTVDFAADSLSGFFKGNGLSLLETTTTACILPIARVVFGPRELTTAFRPLWKKVMANVVAKLSLPAGWASIAVDSANELVPLMVSLATAEPVVGYDLTWRNGDLVAVSRNDARPVPDNRPRVAAPIAKFRFTPKTGRTVFFDASQSSVDTAHGARARYTWDFGDGSRGTGQTVTHAYAAPGRHRVVLKVDDGLGHVATLSHIVDVSNGSAPVIANLTCGPEPSSATSARRISVSAQVTDPDGDLSEVRWYASASDATPETVTGPGFTGNVVLAYPSDGIGVYAPAVEAIDVAGNRSGRKICTYDTRRKGWGLIDDFSTGLGNWVVKSGNWHVQGQTLQVNYDITCGAVTCPHADLLLADKYQGSGDYVASVDFTRTRSGYDFSEAHVDFSLWQSASNRLDIGIGWGAYHWSGGPLNAVRVFVQRWNGTWSRVFYKTVRVTWDPDAWNRATIKKKGNTYSLFLNGTYLATFHDTLLNGTGKLGLAAYGTRKLDNFRLEYY